MKLHRLAGLGLAALAGLALILAPLASAAEKPLTISFRDDCATLDPHGRSETTTMNIQFTIYDRLVKQDQELRIVPDLAESWRLVDDHTWEFKLRKGVKFHNGEPFDAQAAKYSLERARNHVKSQFRGVVPAYKEIVCVDEHTLRLVTTNPEPECLLMLTNINMVPPKLFSEKDDLWVAANAVGTGAYKFVKWVKGEYLELVRNDAWHGGSPEFERVVFKPIPEDATRVAALISGETDICWGVSIPDIPRIEKNPNTYVDRCPSARVIYLMFDVFTAEGGPAPDKQPGIPAGRPNIFRDVRARQAVAHGVNVGDIIKYVMEGSAYPASQIVCQYAPGFNPNLKRPAHDPEKAKKLLEEVGHKGDYVINFDTPNDRYINDQQVAEAVAHQLSKIGLKIKVVATPKAVFFPKVDKYQSPLFLVGWGMLSWTGTMNNFFFEKKGPFGRNNRGRFKDAELEKLIQAANTTMDDLKRNQLRHQAMARAMETCFLIPLYYQENVNGYSKRIIGQARVDEYVFAYEIKKAK